MIVKFERSILSGDVVAPPSKSMSHRMLLIAALSGGRCKVDNLTSSEDVLAMIDCIKSLGASVELGDGYAVIDGSEFPKLPTVPLNCRESGNTLRFLIPIALTLGESVTFIGKGRLMERPQSVYESLCAERGYEYIRGNGSVTVCGKLNSGIYTVDGSVSSQFITGLIMALLTLEGDSKIKIMPPFESKSYIDLTISAVEQFGGKVLFNDELTISVKGKSITSKDVIVEEDYSNSAFLDAFNCIGGRVNVFGLSDTSAQGDRVYRSVYPKLVSGCPTVDISDCPDLGPIYMALGSVLNGCRLTGTRRLAMKESDRGVVMKEELHKFGVDIDVCDNEIIVPKVALKRPDEVLCGHNDHRIVMALSVICTVVGGEIKGCEAVRKTYPDFFEVIKKLGAKVEIKE